MSVTVQTMEQQLDCALDLMRRLPPQKIEKNLSDLIDLVRHSGCSVAVHLLAAVATRRCDKCFVSKLKYYADICGCHCHPKRTFESVAGNFWH